MKEKKETIHKHGGFRFGKNNICNKKGKSSLYWSNVTCPLCLQIKNAPTITTTQ